MRGAALSGVLLLAAASGALVAQPETPSAPAAEPNPAATTPAVARARTPDLGRLLDEAGLRHGQDEDGTFQIVFRFPDDRRQGALARLLDDGEGVALVEVFSPVLLLEGGLPVPADLARELLAASGGQKIGYFGTEEIEGDTWVFAYHTLPAPGLTAETLSLTLQTVASLADGIERDRLERDDY